MKHVSMKIFFLRARLIRTPRLVLGRCLCVFAVNMWVEARGDSWEGTK